MLRIFFVPYGLIKKKFRNMKLVKNMPQIWLTYQMQKHIFVKGTVDMFTLHLHVIIIIMQTLRCIFYVSIKMETLQRM